MIKDQIDVDDEVRKELVVAQGLKDFLALEHRVDEVFVEGGPRGEAEVGRLESDAQKVGCHCRRLTLAVAAAGVGCVAARGVALGRRIGRRGGHVRRGERIAHHSARLLARVPVVFTREQIDERKEAARGVRVQLAQMRCDVRQSREAIGVYVSVRQR